MYGNGWFGATVVGRAKIPPQRVVDLPSPALFQTMDGSPAVWVVDRGKATVSLRPISVLQYDTGTVLVSSGLDAGDLVVVGGIQKLRPGQRVALRQENQA